ncbi:MAG TPA: C10 family peptidase [Cyclobacteriaceae bacterium]
MNIKKILPLILLFVCTAELNAQTVSQSDAELAAQNFINNSINPSTGAKFGLKSIIKTIKNVFQGNIVSYTVLFDGGGFATVAAALNVDPIISYSPVGQFIESNMPTEYLWFMDDYHNLVNYVITNAIIDLTAQSAWANLTGPGTVNQLMTSTWSQSGCVTTSSGIQSLTYNKLINDGGKGGSCSSCNGVSKCAAGCVAVAIGQIMRYWGYPIADYDWCNMPNALTGNPTNTQIDAVAKLLADIGPKVDMKYCNDGCDSQAWHDMVSTFKSYGYPNCTQIFLLPDVASFAIWKKTIKTEIQSGRPVFYSGSTKSGSGHAWVIDGIDPNNDNMFHFNFGWGGYQNAYYHLLDYHLIGTEAYDRINGAIINISPSAVLDCNSSVTIPANAQLSASKFYAGTITSLQTIASGTQNYYACGSIVLKPGFKAASGSNFVASVTNICSRTTQYSGSRIATSQVEEVTPKDSINSEAIVMAVESEQGILSYPNPFKDILELEVNITSEEPFMISIYSTAGENLFNRKELYSIGKHHLNYDLSFLKSGEYICVFKNYSVVKESKIIKQ